VATWAHINTFPNGSTGGIMMKEHHELLAAGEDSHVFWGRGRAAEDAIHEYRFSTDSEVYLDALQTRLDGRAAFHSKTATRRLLVKLDELKPDVVHLHNLHGYYVNVEMLFSWLASHQEVRVEWTLHDCWAFTGHCAHFTYAKCTQWKTHCAYCEKCPQLGMYPKTIAGSSSCRWSFDHKRCAFTSIPRERLKIITPSYWLADLVRQSFLKNYPVNVRHNTIDKTVFKPTSSDFRKMYDIGNRFMVLGVANPWTERKGLSDFMRLAGALDQKRFAIVLVGLSKKQIRLLPDGIIGLARTDSPRMLAGIYSTANVFFNPTKEDNFPTVNLEAEACGTPVITYDTGGCSETIMRSDSKVVSEYSDALDLIANFSESFGDAV